MIIIHQTVPSQLEELKGMIPPEQAAEMFFTSGHRELLDQVRQESTRLPSDPRLVVVTSSRFYSDQPRDQGATTLLSPSVLASGVKAMCPTAWYFVCSVMAIADMRNIDGIIPKEVDFHGAYASLLKFIEAEPDKVLDLETLKRRLSWIE